LCKYFKKKQNLKGVGNNAAQMLKESPSQEVPSNNKVKKHKKDFKSGKDKKSYNKLVKNVNIFTKQKKITLVLIKFIDIFFKNKFNTKRVSARVRCLSKCSSCA